MITRVSYTGDGANATFDVPFPYIDQADVKVTVNGATKTFTWVTSSRITLDDIPVNGAAILLYRETPVTNPLVDFVDGAVLTAEDLDLAVLQILYRQQEQSDILGGELTRSIKVPSGETAGPLPAAAARADQVFTFDQNGLPKMIAVSVFSAEKGDPGGNSMSIGLFSEATALSIPAGTDLVHTSGYSVKGIGAARYVNDAAVDAAYVAANPKSSFMSVNGRGFRLAELVLTPDMLGALGDGVTNDTLAFNTLAAMVNAAGGGVVMMRPAATYIVGLATDQTPEQTAIDSYTFKPSDILKFENLTRPLYVEGNGAELKAPDGYKFGTFDDAGNPTFHTPPFTGPEIASCYNAMIAVHSGSAPALVQNFRLNGNIENAQIGGPWDDTGYQIPGSGLYLKDNTGRWLARNIETFHHGLDGVYVSDVGTATSPLSGSGTDGVNSYENGRQALSITGGVGLQFRNSKFNRTRRGTPMGSAPSAGVDLEADGGKIVRHVQFDQCEFVDNHGVAVLDGGSLDVSHVTFRNCKLIGTTNYSYFSAGAGNMKFQNCTIVGAMTNLTGGRNGELFENCLITDDDSESPTGLAHSPSNLLLPDLVDGITFRGGEVRVTKGGSNGNYNGALFDSVRLIAKNTTMIVFGRFRGDTRFIEEGTGIVNRTPGALGGSVDIGDAEDPWRIIRAGGAVEYYPSTKWVEKSLAYNAALTFDASEFRGNRAVTLTGNATLGTPTNLKAGQTGRIRVQQDATGGRTLAYSSAWKFPGGAPTLTATANAVDVIDYVVRNSTTITAVIHKDIK